jgi:methyl-accepting chemotaxis protein
MRTWLGILKQWMTGSHHSQLSDLDLERLNRMEALHRVVAMIEYDLDGNVLDANQTFLDLTGYTRDEVLGQHHRMFLPLGNLDAPEHKQFWQKLCKGEAQTGQFKRLSKGNREDWIEGSFIPLKNQDGQVVKIVNYFSLITALKARELESQGQIDALNRVLGVIEFSLDGTILALNQNFARVTGYDAAEVVGKHHRIFMPHSEASSSDYIRFWQDLARGEFKSGIYKRIAKNGQEVWLQATYNPILDSDGKPLKIIKFATDITQQKARDLDLASQLSAIRQIMAVIEFDLQGNILDANDNFLNTVGYQKSAVVGKHHKMFVPSDVQQSAEYAQFWQKLAQGNTQAGVYQRVAANGNPLWLQASYNPILDLNGKPYKIVKYAIDVTEQRLRDIDNQGQMTAIQRSLGTIEFSLDGHITKVNANFMQVVGYQAAELIGKHHSMFMPLEERHSMEYKNFWHRLGRGEFMQGVFKRIDKHGQEIWLQASYNPVLDEHGKPIKVVKFATDITQQKRAETGLMEAVLSTEQLLEAAQHGDMTARIDLHGKTDQILSLSNGINRLMDRVSEILLQVKEATTTINSAANEISTGNIDLSTRTERQAHSLQETSSSMSQLAATVKQNAENALQANRMAEAASKVAERGGEVVNQVVDTMTAISQSARKIEDIISVIDGIAFQTNILALNAAVEAARAGEQGKGFAVVAGEVRNLAQRSASAAREIKDLIADSVNKTTEGTQLVEGAGQTMVEIVQSVKRVSDIISEISEASIEQTSGIDSVNQAITSMDDVTQQNAALVEEAAAAAESLVEQASQLSDLVADFNLNEATQNKAKPPLSRTGTYN